MIKGRRNARLKGILFPAHEVKGYILQIPFSFMMYGLNVLFSGKTRYVVWFAKESDREKYIEATKKNWSDRAYVTTHKITYPAEVVMVRPKGKSIKDIYESVQINSYGDAKAITPV